MRDSGRTTRELAELQVAAFDPVGSDRCVLRQANGALDAAPVAQKGAVGSEGPVWHGSESARSRMMGRLQGEVRRLGKLGWLC